MRFKQNTLAERARGNKLGVEKFREKRQRAKNPPRVGSRLLAALGSTSVLS